MEDQVIKVDIFSQDDSSNFTKQTLDGIQQGMNSFFSPWHTKNWVIICIILRNMFSKYKTLLAVVELISVCTLHKKEI